MRAVAVAIVCSTLLAGCDYVFRLDELPPVPAGDSIVVPPGRWEKVDAGDGFTCGITTGHELYCWGFNDDGQIGLGVRGNEHRTPEFVGVGYVEIAAGVDHACAIRDDDTLMCWGDNGDGQLGDGTLNGHLGPTAVTGGLKWKSVDAGDDWTCAIAMDDSLYCWGNNSLGQLGTGNFGDVSSPTKVMTSVTAWAQVALGVNHTCGLDTGGVAYCWGHSYAGELGNGATEQTMPAPVAGGNTYKQLAVGNSYTCGVRTDGRIDCWGDNRTGMLGNNNFENATAPSMISSQATTWSSVAAGWFHTCATQTDGSVWCWGDPHASALPGTTAVKIPTLMTNASAGTTVIAGKTHTCWLTAEHGLACVGDGSAGQLGSPDLGLISSPVQVPGTWTAVAPGMEHTCALDDAGKAWCWGTDQYSQLGDTTHIRSLVPRKVADTAWSAITAGVGHTCTLDTATAHSVYSWGAAFSGSLGNSNTMADMPTLSTMGLPIGQVATSRHTCAVTTTGSVYCWGTNDQGQTGQTSSMAAVNTPMPVSGAGYTAVAVGERHTCALSGVNILCWGTNTKGQLGNNMTTGSTSAPTLVNGSSTYVAVVAGWGRTCGRTMTGNWNCWGNNSDHELLDNGNTNDFAVPTALVTSWDTLALGQYHTCGIKAGSLRCWGTNRYGQVGNGNVASVSTPASLPDVWSGVAAGQYHTCGFKQDKTLWCWGSNRDGQLGTDAGWTKTAVVVQ